MPLYGFAREEMSFSVIACYLALLISCPWNTDSSADQKFLLCLAHTKTNMAQPTQQGSLRLSTVLSGYLFYKHWNYWRGWIRVYSELLKFNDGLSLPHPHISVALMAGIQMKWDEWLVEMETDR